MKNYTIIITKIKHDGIVSKNITGSFAYLKSYFQQDLIFNKTSWEQKQKVKTNPRDVAALVENLNNAANNANSHYPKYQYTLAEQ